MSATQFLTLPLLSKMRLAAGLAPKHVVTISETKRTRDPRVGVITIDRLKELENLPRHEPTYAEARDLARILLLPGIVPLITPMPLFTMSHVLGPLRPDDIYYWRMSEDVPLSVACRITIALGLDDPLELEHMPVHTQLWATIEANERGAAPGVCPWCLGADGDHLPTCLPNVVWAPQSTHPYITATFPQTGRPSKRGDSRIANGLKACRARKGITARKLANDVKVHPNTISRIEQHDIPLTRRLAEKIAPLLGVTVDALYD